MLKSLSFLLLLSCIFSSYGANSEDLDFSVEILRKSGSVEFATLKAGDFDFYEKSAEMPYVEFRDGSKAYLSHSSGMYVNICKQVFGLTSSLASSDYVMTNWKKRKQTGSFKNTYMIIGDQYRGYIEVNTEVDDIFVNKIKCEGI